MQAESAIIPQKLAQHQRNKLQQEAKNKLRKRLEDVEDLIRAKIEHSQFQKGIRGHLECLLRQERHNVKTLTEEAMSAILEQCASKVRQTLKAEMCKNWDNPFKGSGRTANVSDASIVGTLVWMQKKLFPGMLQSARVCFVDDSSKLLALDHRHKLGMVLVERLKELTCGLHQACSTSLLETPDGLLEIGRRCAEDFRRDRQTDYIENEIRMRLGGESLVPLRDAERWAVDPRKGVLCCYFCEGFSLFICDVHGYRL